MKLSSKKLLSGFLASLAFAAGTANATVVNFDNLIGNGPVPAEYGGISWEQGWHYLAFEFPPFNAHSNPTRIYSESDENGFTFGDSDQVFEGAWFAGYYYVSFELFDDGLLVHTSPTLQLFGTGPAQFLATGYEGLVDAVRVVGIAGAYVMDDVTYHAAVDEPGMPSLMLVGMLAAAALNAGTKKSHRKAVRMS